MRTVTPRTPRLGLDLPGVPRSDRRAGRRTGEVVPRWRRGALAVAVASTVGLAACASVPNPTGEMATARAAVDSARRAGAGQLAAAEMNDAQTQLTRAERAQAGKAYEDARRAAELARVSAEIAEERTRLAKARQARSELEQTLRALRGSVAPTAPTAAPSPAGNALVPAPRMAPSPPAASTPTNR